MSELALVAETDKYTVVGSYEPEKRRIPTHRRPPLSRFGMARQETKERVIAALQILFDRYKGIGE